MSAGSETWRPAEVLSRLRTADGLFMTDENQCIQYWSPSAARVLGIEAKEALGRPCYEVMVGTDFRGHPFCRDRCPVAGNAKRKRPVRDYDVVVESKDGRRIVINTSIVLWPAPDGSQAVVHLFREVKSARRPAALQPFSPSGRRPRPPARGDLPATPLSRRELEVLRLAGGGLRTAEIAASLGVSLYTARNQLSSVLRKLGVRSRVEAVVRASEAGLI